MLLVYLLARQFVPRSVIPVTLFAGILVIYMRGTVAEFDLIFSPAYPVFVMPSLNLPAIVGIGIPLFIVTMAAQNIPGIVVMRAHGYEVDASPLISWTGVTGLILAPFGGFAFNLAAITAAICMGKDVHHDPAKRYPAVIWASFFYMLAGLFGSTIVGLFLIVPTSLIITIAGLALLSTTANSLATAMSNKTEREIAFVTFAVTASGISLFSISAPFWGVVIGMTLNLFKRRYAQ